MCADYGELKIGVEREGVRKRFKSWFRLSEEITIQCEMNIQCEQFISTFVPPLHTPICMQIV